MIIIEDKSFSGRVMHGFFGKQGGVSEGIYESLNCGIGSNDDKANVLENKARVSSHFGQSPHQLCSLYQIHSPDCIIVKDMRDTKEVQADAMVTDQSNLILGVLTADCGPVLFEGENEEGAPVIGVAHAGWKGAIGGILESTLNKMQELGAPLETIRVAVGPCIGSASYEVTDSFAEPFLSQSPENEHFFKEARKDGHLMFDLPGYIAARCAQYGVGNITITGHDTYADEENFFSYRRKTHRGEPDYGRQISAIMIK